MSFKRRDILWRKGTKRFLEKRYPLYKRSVVVWVIKTYNHLTRGRQWNEKKTYAASIPLGSPLLRRGLGSPHLPWYWYIHGVPVLGCNCAVCRSKDPRDKRLRTSALLETATTRIVIDSGPDFRQQMLAQTFRKIDGLLITHIHYDHVGGIDDVRPFCALGDIDVYANATTCEGLRHNFPYCFTDHLYPGVPKLNLHSILPHAKFVIGDIEVTPITVMHGKLPHPRLPLR